MQGHIAERERALAAMISSLRHGGWLLIEDADPALQPLACLDVRGPDEALANKLRAGFRGLLAERGADLAYGRKLPHLLRDAGLRDVRSDAYFAIALPGVRAARAKDDRARPRSADRERPRDRRRDRSPPRQHRRRHPRSRDLPDDLGVGPAGVAQTRCGPRRSGREIARLLRVVIEQRFPLPAVIAVIRPVRGAAIHRSNCRRCPPRLGLALPMHVPRDVRAVITSRVPMMSLVTSSRSRSLLAALVPLVVLAAGSPARAQPAPAPDPQAPQDPYDPDDDSDDSIDEPDEAPAPSAPAESAPVQPPTAQPAAQPPPPPASPPAAQAQAVPQPAPQAQPSATGQWVYTQQYGWIWMPYGNQYVYTPEGTPGGTTVYPSAYVYYPAYGWTWLAAPWVWGWGPRVYFSAGPRYYGWWGHPRFIGGFRGYFHGGHYHAPIIHRGFRGPIHGGHFHGGHFHGGHFHGGHGHR